MPTHKIKAIDIAHLAGVSQPTVSRALRNSPLVSKKTREKVQAIAKELNYKVDVHASNLRTQHTNTLALLIRRDSEDQSTMINPFFTTMLTSITHAAARHGYDLLVSFQQLSQDWIADYESSKKADGIIFLGYGAYTDYIERISSLKGSDAHIVTWGPVVEGQPGYFVGCDNFSGGYQVAKHLLELGHKNIAFIGDISDDSPEYRDRFNGFSTALQEADLTIDPLMHHGAHSSEECGYTAARELLNRDMDFTAVFCVSDLIAIGAIRAFNKHGLNVPEDISVAGFDDIPRSTYINPALTTVKQDTQHAGELLVDALIALIHDEEPSQIRLLEPSLIKRDSTKILFA
ncbi:MAG: LacI family transcriptional regulator [Gammaproteobacteria bacterium]|nr:LacI family transcriptional regulator [Gammaproteobacteria bacterium]